MRFRAGFAIALLGISALAFADRPGWFWYQLPPPLPPKPKPMPKPVAVPKPTPVKPKKKTPPPLSVQWIRVELPKLRDQAINNPSTKNVTQYLAVQKVMFDKAQNFAEKFVQVANTNPVLDYSNFVPRSNAGNSEFNTFIAWRKQHALQYLTHHVGIWVFVKHDCPFCNLQLRQYRHLEQLAHFHTVYIDVNGGSVSGVPKNAVFVRDHGQAKMLHLVETPSIVMVWPPDNFAIVSQGYQVEASLEQNLLADASYVHLLPNSISKWSTQAYERGVMTTKQIQAAEQAGITTPQQISQYIEEQTAQRVHHW
jgi:conjugal transfer pilus assembly protein TraF